MVKNSIIDASEAGKGVLSINTTPIVNKIPNYPLQLVVKTILKIVADSGYVNVTVTIVLVKPLMNFESSC